MALKAHALGAILHISGSMAPQFTEPDVYKTEAAWYNVRDYHMEKEGFFHG